MDTVDLFIENANIVDVYSATIKNSGVAIHLGKIVGFSKIKAKKTIDAKGQFLLPGLIDSHVHIESSMLSPAGFASLILPLGTTTIIADPHEMANVRGKDAVLGLINTTKSLPLTVKVMVPSCVPALAFEDTGAVIDAQTTKELLENPDVFGLGEVMNVPGVIHKDPEVLSKVLAAKALGKPIDGHAPLVTGKDLETYAYYGVKTDHECSTKSELTERISLGMYVAIREGAQARNLTELANNLTAELTRRCMFCTDDKDASDIKKRGHIASMLKTAVTLGINPIDAVRMSTLNPAQCYNLTDRGAIAPGLKADMILVRDLKDFEVTKVWVDGNLVAENGKLVITPPKDIPGFLANTVNIKKVTESDFSLKAKSGLARAIGLLPHSLLTPKLEIPVKTDTEGLVHLKDNPGLIKLAVVERHKASGRVGVTLLDPKYGLQSGAIATSVSHDSHNIVVAGDNEADMAVAVNEVARMQGGIVMVSSGKVLDSLALPVAGLMSNQDPEIVAQSIEKLVTLAKTHFKINKDSDAFMTLSFLALPVIPHLKLTTKGLFDVDSFKFVDSDALI